ncbi:MAG: hypothetical protein EB161_07715, partial [Nitrosopumilaceae archaeon]|nr:hypothetical protein [Nitrosopumilaceae archaeon]
FEKNGVNVELIFNIDYSDSQQKYLNGEVDGVCQVLADTIIQNKELPSKIVYVIDYSTSGDVIVSPLSSVNDLKGKAVGVEGINSFSHLFFIKILESHGMGEDDVFFKSVPAHNVIKEIESGNIVAGHTWEPTRSLALSKNYYSLGTAAEFPYLVTDVITFNSKVINDRPKELHAIVISLSEAQEFIKTNPDEALKIMSKNSQMPSETMFSGINAIHVTNIDENQNVIASSEGLLYQNAKIVSQFYFDRGQILSIPAYEQIIEPRFVNQQYKD